LVAVALSVVGAGCAVAEDGTNDDGQVTAIADELASGGSCTGADVRAAGGALAGAAAACLVDKSRLYCSLSALTGFGNMLTGLCEKGCFNFCSQDGNLGPGKFRCDTQPGACAERDRRLGFMMGCAYYSSLNACNSVCGPRKGNCVTATKDGIEIAIKR
jgi:hypothetical protein